MASAPVRSVGWSSVSGVQFAPASVDFQTPPLEAPN
jgi:hypothetical protein